MSWRKTSRSRSWRNCPTVRELLRTDVEAAYEGDPAAASLEEIIVAYPFIETIAIQRMSHVLYRKELPLIPRMMTEWAHSRTGIDHPSRCADRLLLFHRSRHGRGHWRDQRDRLVGEAVSGRVPGGPQFSKGRARPHRQRRQAAPGRGRPRHHLCQHDDPRRGHARRVRQHSGRQRFFAPQRASGFARLLRWKRS